MKFDRIHCFFYRQKLNSEYSQQFLSVLQQWELDMQKFEEQGEKLTVSITTDFIIVYYIIISLYYIMLYYIN